MKLMPHYYHYFLRICKTFFFNGNNPNIQPIIKYWNRYFLKKNEINTSNINIYLILNYKKKSKKSFNKNEF